MCPYFVDLYCDVHRSVSVDVSVSMMIQSVCANRTLLYQAIMHFFRKTMSDFNCFSVGQFQQPSGIRF